MWSSYRLTPVPADAPPFVILGGPHIPMRVVPYVTSRADRIGLDERWAIDVTQVAASPGTPYAPGDLSRLRRAAKPGLVVPLPSPPGQA
jgi:hypothetical protein